MNPELESEIRIPQSNHARPLPQAVLTYFARRSFSSSTVPKLRPPKLNPVCNLPEAPTRAPRDGTPR